MGEIVVDTPYSDPNTGYSVPSGQPMPTGADVDFFNANGEWYKIKMEMWSLSQIQMTPVR